jgi:hypothetical protein
MEQSKGGCIQALPGGQPADIHPVDSGFSPNLYEMLKPWLVIFCRADKKARRLLVADIKGGNGHVNQRHMGERQVERGLLPKGSRPGCKNR